MESELGIDVHGFYKVADSCSPVPSPCAAPPCSLDAPSASPRLVLMFEINLRRHASISTFNDMSG